MLRLGQALLAVLLVLTIVLTVAQDIWIFFVTSVFPRASSWLAGSMLALAVALLLSALTPRTAADPA